MIKFSGPPTFMPNQFKHSERAEQAQRFRELHHGGRLLVLPNAWDAASARIFETAGFPAVATTSAGMAWTVGRPDGERISRATMLQLVTHVTRSVKVPVSADLEAGFADTPSDFIETVRGAIVAGAVGLNVEDGTVDPARPLHDLRRQTDFLRAGKRAARDAGIDVFLNARTDVFWRQVGDPATQLRLAIERCQAFVAAGADGVFLPSVSDPEAIRQLVKEIPAPLNVLAGAGTPGLKELEDLGVARVTFGSGPMRKMLAGLREFARNLGENGDFSPLTENAIPFDEVNRLFLH